MDSEELRIVAERPTFIVVDKPQGIATVPLARREPLQQPTLLDLVARHYPECCNPMGEHPWEGGVVHRLDSATSGLVLIARSVRSFQRFMDLQQSGLFRKSYLATSLGVDPTSAPLQGFPPGPCADASLGLHQLVHVSSMFRPFGPGRTTVRPVTGQSAIAAKEKSGNRIYATDVLLALQAQDSGLCFSCRIAQGFRHQIRCHLAWCGFPLTGDTLYGGIPHPVLHLAAVSFTFPDERGCEVRFDLPELPAWVPLRIAQAVQWYWSSGMS